MATWNILVVDDEPDVHQAAWLVLKHRQWRGHEFALTSVHSRQAAESVLMTRGGMFHVALVDCVMESNSAGLELCRLIHSRDELSVRTILHSGIYSEHYARWCFGHVFDAFLPKAEVTALRLYNTICSCIGNSQQAKNDPALQLYASA